MPTGLIRSAFSRGWSWLIDGWLVHVHLADDPDTATSGSGGPDDDSSSRLLGMVLCPYGPVAIVTAGPRDDSEEVGAASPFGVLSWRERRAWTRLTSRLDVAEIPHGAAVGSEDVEEGVPDGDRSTEGI